MNVYQPAEDTLLLKEHLAELDLEGKKVLEVGTGSGLIAVTAAEHGAQVVATDVNPDALEAASKLTEKRGVQDTVELVESDLFENVEKKFDYILFNPPYLPGEELEDSETWRGGETGTELTERFLEEAPDYLEDSGKIYFIASSRSDIRSLKEQFDIKEVDSENLWFETLYLFKSD